LARGRVRPQLFFDNARLADEYCMIDTPDLSASAVALLQIMLINVVLSGDNAVVIALACRNLSPAHRKQAFLWGGVGVIVLMLLLTVSVVYLMRLPWLQFAGGVLLLWIGVKLLVADGARDSSKVGEQATLNAAIRTIIAADVVMSLDNVLAMAAAANGHIWMLGVGLAVTVPLVLFGSAYLMRVMHKFPMVVLAGAALIGYVAGNMLVSDPALRDWIAGNAPYMPMLVPVACAILVVAAGTAWQRLRRI
jgi:YjbE family integral membrane protein